jgi:hypothetical protein
MGNLDVLLNRLFNKPNSLDNVDELTLLFEGGGGGGNNNYTNWVYSYMLN